MSRERAAEIISTLEKGSFYAECPCCDESMPLKNAGLFYRKNFSSEARELYEEKIAQLQVRSRNLRHDRKQISVRSEVGARGVNIGKILERLAPSLKSFRFERNDCRSLFDPIDYLIFEGLSRKNTVSKLFFVEIKTGSGRLNEHQEDIKSIVEKKALVWNVYRRESMS